MNLLLSRRFRTFLAVMLATTAHAATMQVEVLPPTLRVGVEGPRPGATSADIYAAKNETESFQVLIRAVGGDIRKVNAEMAVMNGPINTLPASVRIYREELVPIRRPGYGPTLGTQFAPDPLVPFVDPFTNTPLGPAKWNEETQQLEPGRFGGFGFDLRDGQHQVLWIDVAVPRDTAAGDYTSALSISAIGAETVVVPVRLHVWDFVLPDGPTHENHFGGFGYALAYDGKTRTPEEANALEERYCATLAANRINPPIPSYLKPPMNEDGSVNFDAVDVALTEFVTRYHLTNIEVPRAPFSDNLGVDRAKAINFFRSWQDYLERKGWLDRAYHYMLDEPNDPQAYEMVRQLGALVQEAAPKLRRLVVEQPYSETTEWGTLDAAIDIWCPLFGFVHEPNIERVRAQGDDVWSYSALVQNAPPYHPEYETVKNDRPPYWEIDYPLTSYRIAPWLNRRYDITGLLYWSLCYWASPKRNPWDDPGFRGYWNGDGFLFYPGNDAGIDGPIESIRLKALRDGMEDYEYFVLLESLGGEEAVDAIVREAVPTWGTWAQDPDTMLTLRMRLAEEILKRK